MPRTLHVEFSDRTTPEPRMFNLNDLFRKRYLKIIISLK